MGEIRIEWSPAKDAANKRKHGVAFEDAATVFSDEHALLLDDEDHSGEEDRFVLLGLSATLRILTVCHCYREEDEVIRIISARKADKGERDEYQAEAMTMKKSYDFSKARKNPYAKRLKKQITIRLDTDAIGYFKELSVETGIPYQTLINLYLRECAASKKKLSMKWRAAS